MTSLGGEAAAALIQAMQTLIKDSSSQVRVKAVLALSLLQDSSSSECRIVTGELVFCDDHVQSHS